MWDDEIFVGQQWSVIGHQLGGHNFFLANDSKQSATWEETQAFKLLWSSVFLILSLLGLLLFVFNLMHLCCRFQGSTVAVAKER